MKHTTSTIVFYNVILVRIKENKDSNLPLEGKYIICPGETDLLCPFSSQHWGFWFGFMFLFFLFFFSPRKKSNSAVGSFSQ